MSRLEAQPNIARAIRRSRWTRAVARSRRKRSLAIAACASLALIIPAAVSLGALGSSNVVHAAVTQARSLIDMLHQRSPGERTQAELTTPKLARAAPAPPRLV